MRGETEGTGTEVILAGGTQAHRCREEKEKLLEFALGIRVKMKMRSIHRRARRELSLSNLASFCL